jgi:uncharacterized protein (TIGR03067 family)
MQDTTADLDRLQGRWNVVAVEVDGRQMPIAPAGGARIVIDGKRFTSLGMGATYEGTFEVDQARKPKAFDLLVTAGHASGTRNLGIYKLDGDCWTICLATRGTRRPGTFATKPGTGFSLETLERHGIGRATTKMKSEARRTPGAVSTRAPSRHAVPSGPATPLEGEWAMVAGVFSGAAMAANMVTWCTRVTRGNVTTVMAGPKMMLKASFTLDDSTRPATIDYVNLEGTHAGKSQAGIVDLRGDTLRICMSAPGQPRPADFSSTRRDGRSYTTWRRAQSDPRSRRR